MYLQIDCKSLLIIYILLELICMYFLNQNKLKSSYMYEHIPNGKIKSEKNDSF